MKGYGNKIKFSMPTARKTVLLKEKGKKEPDRPKSRESNVTFSSGKCKCWHMKTTNLKLSSGHVTLRQRRINIDATSLSMS